MADNEELVVQLLETIAGHLKTQNELLANQNKMLGALSQGTAVQMKNISGDLEIAKVHLGKLVKMGPPEVTVPSPQGGSQGSSFQETPSTAIPGLGD